MRIRLPERLSLVDLILWGLRVAIVVFVSVGTYATLTEGALQCTDWRDLIVYGIAQGSVYALIALGYTLVYGVLFMINFAHGDVFMAGAMTAFFVADYFGDTGFINENTIVALAVIFAVSMLTSAIVAIVLERIAYRPLRRAPRLVPLITAIGASLFIANSVRGLYGERIQTYPNDRRAGGPDRRPGHPDPEDAGRGHRRRAGLHGGPLRLRRAHAHRARHARRQRGQGHRRADGHRRRSHHRHHLRHRRPAGRRGRHPVRDGLHPGHWFMGFLPGIKAFTAAVLGGIGNIVGAMLGGLTLGVLESVGPYLLLSGFDVPSPNQLRDVVAFGVLVLVLIFRPNGILGRPEGSS